MAVVYLATNRVNGKRYVGATGRGLPTRRRDHEREALKGGDGCRKFHRAIRKYGTESFDWAVLVECENLEAALQHEMRLIAEIRPEYNLKAGGQGSATPRVMSAEVRARWRAKVVGQKRTPEQRARLSAARMGRKHSAETRSKISAARKGIKFSDAQLQNMALAQLGKKQSPEMIEKRIANQRGRPLSAEHRAKISAVRMGHGFTDEARKKMSVTRKGRKLSLEHRAAISAALFARSARLQATETSP